MEPLQMENHAHNWSPWPAVPCPSSTRVDASNATSEPPSSGSAPQPPCRLHAAVSRLSVTAPSSECSRPAACASTPTPPPPTASSGQLQAWSLQIQLRDAGSARTGLDTAPCRPSPGAPLGRAEDLATAFLALYCTGGVVLRWWPGSGGMREVSGGGDGAARAAPWRD